MKLRIENIGPFIGSQEIAIDGITVLAGLNGTGKSTFGKVLYCFFNAFKDIEFKIEEDRKKTIHRHIWNALREGNNNRKVYTSINQFINKLYETNETGIRDNLKEEFLNEFKDADISQEDKENIIKKIQDVLRLDDNIIREKILSNCIEAEFGDQIRNIYADDKDALAELTVNNRRILFTYKYDLARLIEYISLIKDVVYIDDPNVADELDKSAILSVMGVNDHKLNLLTKLQKPKSEDYSSVDQILIQKKINSIEERINEICDGDISFIDSQRFLYVSDTFKNGLNIGNMATGLKTFAILKMLLKKGCLEENGIIVFDEPEIHLHPEWQRAWAEIIVLLHKEFGMHTLISTHSSEFLSFIELFSHKYMVDSKTKVYNLEKNREGDSTIRDVSDNWDIVYRQLGRPFIKATEELDAIINNK